MTKNKVTGIMRVKNDGMFIERCIESCIDALDELIVVHNDCTDNSVEEIEKMREKYPDKIKRYEYPHRVMGVGLTKEEYQFVKDLPEGSPHLLSTYCNFALSKVTTSYALKIDADQVYFTETLKEWCDFIRNCEPQKLTLKVLVGKMFDKYFSLYRLLSLKCNKVMPLLPTWLLKMFYPTYISYAKYAFSHDKACFSMSGLNVLETENIMIPMGHQAGDWVSGIPFNGEGDTVMFKIKDSTYFAKMPDYSTRKDSLVEQFIHPYKIMYVGFFWTHIRVMRPSSYLQAMNILKVDPNSYITYDEFKKLSYNEIMSRSSKSIFRIFQRMLFSFIYKANKQQLIHSLER
jgi:glycosyltransferase involved in cell wall biosynthesis